MVHWQSTQTNLSQGGIAVIVDRRHRYPLHQRTVSRLSHHMQKEQLELAHQARAL